MDKRFEKRLMLAANPRMRKRHEKKPPKFVRAKSHVEAVVRDMLAGGECGNARIFDPNPVKMSDNIAGAVFAPAMAVRNLAIAAAMDGADAVKKRMGKKERMKQLARRRKYYAAAAVKREARRKQVRETVPKPAHRCPTAKELTEAYLRRREGDEWKRFGDLMIDLEEHARREYAITGNKFAGSSGGVKDWLKEKCPLLAKHYSTCQRYKRLAQDYYDTQVKD